MANPLTRGFVNALIGKGAHLSPKAVLEGLSVAEDLRRDPAHAGRPQLLPPRPDCDSPAADRLVAPALGRYDVVTSSAALRIVVDDR